MIFLYFRRRYAEDRFSTWVLSQWAVCEALHHLDGFRHDVSMVEGKRG